VNAQDEDGDGDYNENIRRGRREGYGKELMGMESFGKTDIERKASC
jgi:hypothetical protein